MRDADDDCLQAVSAQRLQCFIDLPLDAGETRRRIKQILPVLHVDRRKASCASGIRRRQIHDDVARRIQLRAKQVGKDQNISGDSMLGPRVKFGVGTPFDDLA